jgi:hypothetical protein
MPTTYRPRASSRRKLKLPVIVSMRDGQHITITHTLDFSTGGAKISIDRSIDLPAEFRITLSERGDVQRLCQLVWRKANEVGVRFIEPKPPRVTTKA